MDTGLAGLVEVWFAPAGVVAFVAPGTTVLEASRAAGVAIATGCTRGMCGTDVVRIVEGGAGLARPAEPERGTLERMGLSADYRLSCSARLERGCVRVETGGF
jgi:ferredoxin